MRKEFKSVKKFLSIFLVLGMVLSLTPVSIWAEDTTSYSDYTWDGEEDHAAFITEKSAQWTNEKDYLAELTLAINGTQYTEPLDVIICLDRSGSMDMEFIITGNGTHTASCPCLNQEHFYLEPTGDIVSVGIAEGEIAPETSKETIIDNGDGTITVYNAESSEWVKLDTSNRTNIFYEFQENNNLYLGAYHFTMDGDKYVRISKWETEDIRKNSTDNPEGAGFWNHADSELGCFDRWMEAKDAVKVFSEAVIESNGENRVALIPFSVRDSTMISNLKGQSYYKQWLIDKGYLDENQSEYNSIVPLTGDANEIVNMLPNLFTTGNTDYVYGLSMAYNMIAEKSDKERPTVVVFLSDGVPYPAGGTQKSNGEITAFCNFDENILALADGITSKADFVAGGHSDGFWSKTDGPYQRHDVNEKYIVNEEGVKGLGAQMLTVGYMINNEAGIERLESMATGSENYINISDSEGTSKGYLADQLLSAYLFPGGRESVLRDEISQYYYIPDNARLPEGVEVEEDENGVQTLVWTIGDIYVYNEWDEPSIIVPLVLKEEYRIVGSTTYYPTNADNPEPSLYDPENGPDGEDTGSKLYYTDPSGNLCYDTIGTPKLPVYPKQPDPDSPSVVVELPGVEKIVTGDSPSKDSEFFFELTGQSGAYMPIGSVGNKKTVSVYGNATTSFGSITYYDAGTYTYTISEIDGDADGYKYDNAVYEIVIEITSVDNELEYTITQTKDGETSEDAIKFTNSYNIPTDPTDPIDPEKPKEDVTLYLNKVLTDDDGNEIGDGKLFAVQILDESGNEVEQVNLPANGSSVKVTGLKKGTAYIVQEMAGENFTLVGYDVETSGNVQNVDKDYVVFRCSKASSSVSITVNNTTETEDDWYTPTTPTFPETPTYTDDEIIDIFPMEVPLDSREAESVEPTESVNEIEPEEVEIWSPNTGDNSMSTWLLISVVAVSVIGLVVIRRKKRSIN